MSPHKDITQLLTVFFTLYIVLIMQYSGPLFSLQKVTFPPWASSPARRQVPDSLRIYLLLHFKSNMHSLPRRPVDKAQYYQLQSTEQGEMLV